MGVDIVVLEFHKMVNGDLVEVNFDQTIKNFGDVIDFRKRGMKWFLYGSKIISGYVVDWDDDHIILPKKLVMGSYDMIEKISQKIGLSLPENPIAARDCLKNLLKLEENLIKSEKNQLESAICDLNTMYSGDKIEEAWALIEKLQMDRARHTKKQKLKSFLDKLERMKDEDDSSKVWKFIEDFKIGDCNEDKFVCVDYPKSKVCDYMEFAELAVFFYICGNAGHPIQWCF